MVVSQMISLVRPLPAQGGKTSLRRQRGLPACLPGGWRRTRWELHSRHARKGCLFD